MVHTRLLRKFAVERHVREKSAHVGCHGVVALWGSLVGGLGATRSSQQQPRAAQESPREPGELWSTSGRAQGDPGHLHYDTFPGDSGSQVFPCKPRPPKPEGTLNPQNRLADAKERPNDLWSSCVALADYSK